MSKIWQAIKAAWIYNLAIFLVGIILVSGEITSSKSAQGGQAADNDQSIKNAKAQENVKQKKPIVIESKSTSLPAQTSKQEIKYEQIEANGPTETKVLDAQKIEIPKSQYVTVGVAGVGEYKTKILPDETAFTIMIRAARENNFSIDYKIYSFGVFITSFGKLKPADNEFWALYYNGVFSQVGASQLKIKENDIISWRIEKW